MALTLMLNFAHSLLRALVIPPTAAFEAVYEATLAPPMNELREPTLMILP